MSETDDEIEIVEAPEVSRKKYPKGTLLLLAVEPLRCYVGGSNRSTTLLMVDRCGYNQNQAIAIYHFFLAITLCIPIFAVSIADRWFGKYMVLIIGCILSTCGLLTTTFMTVPSYRLPIRFFFWLGGLTRAIGFGCLNPTFNSIGAEQFDLPSQSKFLSKYFIIDYLLVNIFLFISIKITPMLRADVHCLGRTDCYTLAFLVPAIFMLIMTITLIICKKLFKFKKPENTDFCVFFSCIIYAISNRKAVKRAGEDSPRTHWLYYAKEKYGEELVKDIKDVFSILTIVIPTSIIWCVYTQFETKWVFQATRLDLRVFGYTMKVEEIIIINTLLCILLLPFIQYIINPFTATCKLHRPLAKMLFGSILIAVAFFLSAKLESEIEDTYPIATQPGVAKFRLFNGVDCQYTFAGFPISGHKLEGLTHFENAYIELEGSKDFTIVATPSENCKTDFTQIYFTINLRENAISSYYFTGNDKPLYYDDILGFSENGYPLIRILGHDLNNTIIFYDHRYIYLNSTLQNHEVQMINPGKFDINIGQSFVKHNNDLLMGGYYVYLITKTNGHFKMKTVLCKAPNKLHVINQVPQIFFMTLGEVLFAVNLIEFIYGEAPNSLKVFVWSFNNLMNGLGQCFVAIFTNMSYIRSFDLYLYSYFLSITLIIFFLLILRYRYKNPIWKI